MSAAVPCVALWASCLFAGCDAFDTVSQDFSSLAKTIVPTTPSEAARMMVDQYNPDQRREGTLLIATSTFGGVDHYVQLYRFMAEHDTDPTVRAVAIRALARYGSVEDARLIADQLKSDSDQVRWEAAKGLQRIHDPGVVPDILAKLRDDEERVETRIALADALAQYPQDRVFQGLILALDARELSVNQTAERSLERLTGETLGSDARDWLRWYNQQDVEQRFASRSDYLFPTYSRRITFFERLAFWIPREWEQPAPPAGLQLQTRRETYQDQ